MFEEQFTENIEAGAPDITYSGNEGPKSPQQEQQQMMMAQLQEQYCRYVFENKSRAGIITFTSLWMSSSGILAAFKASSLS